MVLKTAPPCFLVQDRSRSSCLARAMRIASGCSSHSRVDPSISVKRKVTWPVGRSTAFAHCAQLSLRCADLASGQVSIDFPLHAVLPLYRREPVILADLGQLG